jgi:Secretion system C-terminal sorting domain
MKKKLIHFLTPILLLGTGNILTAQSLEMRDAANNNAVVPSGTTLYFTLALNTTHTLDVDAYNISTHANTYVVRKKNVTIMNGANTWFCVFYNGNAGDPQSHCLSNVDTVSLNMSTDAGDFNRAQADYSAGPNAGLTLTRYRFENTSDPADTVSLIIYYYSSPVGIANPFSSNQFIGQPQPNPSTGIVTFPRINNQNEAVQIQVTDLTGKLVKSELTYLSGEIRLDLSDLPVGMYICRFNSGGNTLYRKVQVLR